MSWRTLYFFVISCSIFFSHQLTAQCVVTGSVNNDISVCGDCVQLSAFGRGQGQIVFQENFNSGAPTGWAFTQQAQFNNPCSPNGVNGTKHIWMGSTSAVPRSLETLPYNFSTAASGVTICFDMLFAEQGNAAPCEGPDEPDEGVYLQYRVGSGNWITIHYFDPNGGYDPQFINWNNWCFPLPPGATTSNVSIRWFQDNDSGADFDHWGIDNVQIYFNDPTYQISWPHNNFSYPVGSSGGINTTPTCPRATTDYVVVMTNGSSTCRDTVRVTVVSPNVEVDAGADLTLCPNECDTLNATAKVIKSPAKTPRYANAEFIPIQSFGGTADSINVNVTGLNSPTVQPGLITSVCIQNLNFFGAQLDFSVFPPRFDTLDIGDFNIRLICPGGGSIILVPAGVTRSSSSAGYINTCFTPVSTTDIANANAPHTGNYMPEEPFSDLNGCSANGLWSIEITSTSQTNFGAGTFIGWSITFDDPEISYPANFTWSPTTNMTNSTTLTPTVCPPQGTHPYQLIAVDSAACVIRRDTVNVTVLPTCCNLQVAANSVAPACTTANGSISLTVTSGSGTYSYAWNDGPNTQNRTALPGGTYTVTVTDLTHANCSFDTTITLTPPNSPVINGVNVTHETCLGDADGTAAVNATGGTAPLVYTWSTGETGISIDSLAAGTYTVTVTDANSCPDIETFTINPGPVCCVLQIAATVTPPGCGLSDGGIDLTITGSGNYTYTWNPPASTQDLTGVPAGNYSVTVHDVTQNCDHDTTISLSNPNAPVIDSITFTPTTCAGGADGTATVFATGGTGTLSYEWGNTETTQTISGLTAGIYLVTVSDANQCETSGSVIVANGPICCNLASTVDTVNATCNLNDGALTIHVITSSGTSPFEFSIDGINYGSDSVFSGLVAGSYNAIARDVNLCADTTTVTITEPSNTIETSITSTDINCFGESDGTASVITTGGNAPLALEWSTTSTNDTITALAAGEYYLTVTDQLNCIHLDTAIIAEPAELTVDLGDDQPICTDSTATFTIGNYAVIAWSTGDSNVTTISFTQPAAVGVTVTDANGCTATDNANVTAYSSPIINTLDTVTIYDFETVTLNTTVSGTLNPSGFTWTPSEGLSCADCQSPVASPDSSIVYYLTYYDLNTCPAYDTVEITVLDGDYFAIVPNAFTPNGDGPNDKLHVYHKALERLVFRVYNRWGSIVFQTTDPNEGWDGTHNGKELAPDVFVYELYAEFLLDVKPQRTAGSVTLLR